MRIYAIIPLNPIYRPQIILHLDKNKIRKLLIISNFRIDVAPSRIELLSKV